MRKLNLSNGSRSVLSGLRLLVDSTGLRSNFMKDLKAIENAEHFIELALDRLDIDSLDELKYVA